MYKNNNAKTVLKGHSYTTKAIVINFFQSWTEMKEKD